MTDAVELIKSAKRAERTVPICTRGDLVAGHEELNRQLDTASRTGKGSLAGNQVAIEAAAAIERLEAEMADSVVEIRLRALPRKSWAAMVAKHSPRKDNETDARAGYNVDEFAAAALRASVVAPELEDDTWEYLVDEVLSDGQYEQLTTAMWELNRSGVSVPFSRAASRIRAVSAPA